MPRPPQVPGPEADLAALARHWAEAIAGASFVPMSQAELAEALTGLVGRIAEQLAGGTDHAAAGAEIGAALVAAQITTVAALGRSIEAVAGRVLPELGHPVGDPAAAGLLGGLATGFAQALRDRTLDEQEEIRRATMHARARAELALRESEARFRYQATHDPLTDLANRILFTERLTDLCASDPAAPQAPRRLGICIIDLDGFKVINDALGHRLGDEVLVTIAGRLRRSIRGHLLARLGGDEFGILVEETTSADDVVKVADAALLAVTEPITLAGHQLSISASIGVVEQELGQTNPRELLRAGDLTLQWAKAEGRHRLAVFDSARYQRELARYALSAALPTALDRTELFLQYQPIVSLADGAVQAVEALVRWQHPELGTIGPERFLQLAEETGLIVRLGHWVLTEACRQARRWEQWSAHPPLISVNVTPYQVRDPGLVDLVTGVLEESGLAPHRLQLELTEESALDPASEPVRTLHQLADQGVRLAVDNFGTGYFNLPYLRTLPVQELKISGQFLANLPEPDGTGRPATADEQILAGLVSMAHTLGLATTGEGVETARQAQALRELGCDSAQGWHFGRPTTPDRLAAVLRGGAEPESTDAGA
jgi:diguanylate cyclase (GGDEF)-like protein